MHIAKLGNENFESVISNKGKYVDIIGRIIDSSFGWLLLAILKNQWETSINNHMPFLKLLMMKILK